MHCVWRMGDIFIIMNCREFSMWWDSRVLLNKRGNPIKYFLLFSMCSKSFPFILPKSCLSEGWMPHHFCFHFSLVLPGTSMLYCQHLVYPRKKLFHGITGIDLCEDLLWSHFFFLIGGLCSNLLHLQHGCCAPKDKGSDSDLPESTQISHL